MEVWPGPGPVEMALTLHLAIAALSARPGSADVAECQPEPVRVAGRVRCCQSGRMVLEHQHNQRLARALQRSAETVWREQRRWRRRQRINVKVCLATPQEVQVSTPWQLASTSGPCSGSLDGSLDVNAKRRCGSPDVNAKRRRQKTAMLTPGCGNPSHAKRRRKLSNYLVHMRQCLTARASPGTEGQTPQARFAEAVAAYRRNCSQARPASSRRLRAVAATQPRPAETDQEQVAKRKREHAAAMRKKRAEKAQQRTTAPTPCRR